MVANLDDYGDYNNGEGGMTSHVEGKRARLARGQRLPDWFSLAGDVDHLDCEADDSTRSGVACEGSVHDSTLTVHLDRARPHGRVREGAGELFVSEISVLTDYTCVD